MKRFVWIVVALAVAACGETTIDSGKLEADIKEDAEHEGLVLDEVDCPSPEVEEGDRFECTVTVKGEERKLEVVQRARRGRRLRPDAAARVHVRERRRRRRGVRAVRDRRGEQRRDRAVRLRDERVPPRARRRELREARDREYDEPMRDYEVSIEGDRATASGSGRTVRLERQHDGSWLIVGVGSRA